MWDDVRSIIKEAREKQKLTQTDLAMMIGKEQSYIICVENAQIKISEDINEIIDALNIDLRKELYSRYRNEFELEFCDCEDYKIHTINGNGSKNLVVQSTKDLLERKTEQTDILIRPSTKNALTKYANEYNTSVNEVINSLALSYITSIKKSEFLCHYAGVTFNAFTNVCINRGEKKSARLNLLLKESTKNYIKEIAKKNHTSLNDIINKLVDAFLCELYML